MLMHSTSPPTATLSGPNASARVVSRLSNDVRHDQAASFPSGTVGAAGQGPLADEAVSTEAGAGSWIVVATLEYRSVAEAGPLVRFADGTDKVTSGSKDDVGTRPLIDPRPVDIPDGDWLPGVALLSRTRSFKRRLTLPK